MCLSLLMRLIPQQAEVRKHNTWAMGYSGNCSATTICASLMNQWHLFCKVSVSLLLSLAVCGCSGPQKPRDLSGWKRVETLRGSTSGHTIAKYERETALSKNQEAVVCEDPFPRIIFVLSPETFGSVYGNTLNIFDTQDRETPGWYWLTRTHGLTC